MQPLTTRLLEDIREDSRETAYILLHSTAEYVKEEKVAFLAGQLCLLANNDVLPDSALCAAVMAGIAEHFMGYPKDRKEEAYRKIAGSLYYGVFFSTGIHAELNEIIYSF